MESAEPGGGQSLAWMNGRGLSCSLACVCEFQVCLFILTPARGSFLPLSQSIPGSGEEVCMSLPHPFSRLCPFYPLFPVPSRVPSLYPNLEGRWTAVRQV